MLHASYEIWGVVTILLLIGVWTLRRLICRQPQQGGGGANRAICSSPSSNHDLEHRALMFLMTQKTDAVLGALARTIDQERQKLGVVVRNPSMTDAIDACQNGAMHRSDNRQAPHEQIVSLTANGVAVPEIARQLHLPEAEVCMVLRLNAA